MGLGYSSAGTVLVQHTMCEVLGSNPRVHKMGMQYMQIYSAFGREKQEDQKCKVILCYRVTQRPVWATYILSPETPALI